MIKRLFPLSLAALALLAAPAPAPAADHGDGPAASVDAAADLGDVYLFLDPNDNTKVCMAMTTRGFIVPSEAGNFGVFDPAVVYRFQLETNGDAIPDASISVTFSRKVSTAAQTATVTMVRGSTQVFSFTAPATAASIGATAPGQVVTTDSGSGVSFYAGETDDPFFFDIVGFNRFTASVLAGTPDPTQLNRGRDSFAGYNTMTIALNVPASLIQAQNNSVGVSAVTLRASRHFDPALINVSTRGNVGTGDGVLIGGFVIAGNTPKRVIVRGLGPSLTARGVTGVIADPRLTIRDSAGALVATNDNWQDTQATEISATPYAPTSTLESAIVITLPPGPYTATVSGATGGTGVGIMEVYDLTPSAFGSYDYSSLTQVDRTGVPAVNVVFIPLGRKDEYNASNTQDDAAGKFANDIVATLTALGTSQANINVLASVAVTKGDFLRLNLTIANSGTGGGINPGAGFPNGRRLGDDVIDTLMSFVTNQSGLTDNVNSNDVAFGNTFPFFGFSQQPRANGVLDDNTRN